MSDGIRRVVQIASIVYVDVDGAIRRADHGDAITVHAENVARFDSLNGAARPVSLDSERPKRRGRPPKNREATGGSVRNIG